MRQCLLFTGISMLLALLAGSFSLPPSAQAASPTSTKTHLASSTTGNPLFVLVEYDPWRMVIGSDSPTFVLYDDGLVIFVRRNKQGNPEYAATRLTGDDFVKLRANLAGNDPFFVLKAHYDLLLPSDQPSNVITLWNTKRGAKQVSVYGDLRHSKEARDLAPQPFVRLFDKAVSYTNPEATSWRPEKFEVIVWETQRSDAVPWPKDWPDLNDPTTIKRGKVYSLYLEWSKLTTFRTLTHNGHALLINGKTWAFSLRYPLPSEEAWQTLKIPS
jgi:hypothetical protein